MSHFAGKIHRSAQAASKTDETAISARRALQSHQLQSRVQIGGAKQACEREANQVAARVMSGQAAGPILQQPAQGLIQRQDEDEDDPRVNSPAWLPTGRNYHVVIIGAPSPGEVRVNHADQFIRAAERHPFETRHGGTLTVWIVERTGYANAGISEADIRARGPEHVYFVDEATSLVSLIEAFPVGSITQLNAYSHGVPGLMALRYGWPDQRNYGLSLSDTRGLSPDSFDQSARLSFDSCNSGTDDDDESLAQAVATATERPTEGWTGRTSYRRANAEALEENRDVVASEISPPGGSFDSTELLSQLRGRYPTERTFTPARSSGSFTSTFNIRARLPESRHFQVPANGTVRITITPRPEIPEANGYPIYLILWREDGWFDDENGGSRRLRLGETGTETWSGLEQGTYWVEIHHPNQLRVQGPISVTIQ